ncbi:hypothetical protein [Streptomyces sp. NPDC058867]|uniref:hypothetical protein n=1 Tax=unclassified Streptomyces TaxID=2593676 RepID=UPI0036C9B96D
MSSRDEHDQRYEKESPEDDKPLPRDRQDQQAGTGPKDGPGADTSHVEEDPEPDEPTG